MQPILRAYKGQDKPEQEDCFWVHSQELGTGLVFTKTGLLGTSKTLTARATITPASDSELLVFNKLIEKIPDFNQKPPVHEVTFQAVDSLKILRQYKGIPSVDKINICPLLPFLHSIEEMEEVRRILVLYGGGWTSTHFEHINPGFVWYMIAQGAQVTTQVYHRFLLLEQKGNVPFFLDWCLDRLAFTLPDLLGSFRIIKKQHHTVLSKYNIVTLLEKVFVYREQLTDADWLLLTKVCVKTNHLETLIEHSSNQLSLSCLAYIIKKESFSRQSKPLFQLGKNYPQHRIEMVLCLVKHQIDAVCILFIEKFGLLEERTLVTRLLQEKLSRVRGLLEMLKEKGVYIDAPALQALRVVVNKKRQDLIDSFLQEDI